MKKQLKKKLSNKEAMALAIEEAEKGIGFVSPNPPVGCVILNKNNEWLSSGFYSHYGAVHAEISALNKIKNKKDLRGAHIFTTLEPCFHFGQNPPCVNSLIKYPWDSLTYGIEDPNPKTNRKSIKKLKSKGFKVKKTAYFGKHLQRLYEAFTVNMRQNRAFFALKTASSLDGVMALHSGESQWITNKSSRDFASHLRVCFDAVLIGIETFLEDNPRLNCRKKAFEKIKNKVCLLDPSGRSLKLISKSRLAKVRPLENIFVITKPSFKNKKEKPPFKLISCPLLNTPPSSFDLWHLSQKLYKENICSVLIEGGAKTLSGFLEQKACQRLYHFISPCLLGGKKGRHWTEQLAISSLKNRKVLHSQERFFFDEDILITGTL